MSVVDMSTWKPFRVGDLFDCETTLGIPSKNNLIDGDISYVTRSAVDNGLSGYCGNLDSVNAGCCITIGAEGFVAFWQPDDFVAGNKVYALRHSGLNELSALFVCAALNVLSSEYSFSNARILDNIKQEVILLPATPDGEPDWAYMETYMRQVLDREEMFAEHLASLTAEAVADGHVIDTSTWKAFRVGDLFDIQKGKRLTKTNMVDGNFPFVGASVVSNGVTAFVGNDACLHDGHCLTVCYNGSVGETFLQKEPFWASDDVNVLCPFSENVSDFALMFVAPCIRSLRRNYGYTNKWTSAKMAEDIIFLPATPDGAPDWAYMEQYMRDVMVVEALFADELDRVYCE